MKKTHKITYLDTWCESGYSYADYVEDCEERGETPAPENSEAYWEWIGDMIRNDIDDFFDNLKYSSSGKSPVVISGNLGLWYGRPRIENTICDDIESAIRKCWGGCDDIEVVLEDGVLHVNAMHHDGTNCFEVRPLTGRGAERLRDGDDVNIHSHWHVNKFPEYLF